MTTTATAPATLDEASLAATLYMDEDGTMWHVPAMGATVMTLEGVDFVAAFRWIKTREAFAKTGRMVTRRSLSLI